MTAPELKGGRALLSLLDEADHGQLASTVDMLERLMADPDRDDLAVVELRMRHVRDLHEVVDAMAKFCEHVKKDLIEPAVWECWEHAEDSLDGEFRWRSGGAAPARARDNGRLLAAAAAHGVTAEAFARAARPLTAKEFAGLIGLSEPRMMELYGDEFEPGAARKPTLLRLR